MSAANVGTTKPEFSDTIRAIVDTVLMDMYFGMPAKVKSYDPATQYATVEIQLFQKIAGELVPYPPIPNVPVNHPRSSDGSAHIHFPVKVGDDVTLMFSSRSLDNWKSSGGMSDPDDPRKNHLSDCFAVLGGSSKADAFDVEDPDAIEIVNGDSKIQVFEDGTFAIKNGTTEFVSQVAAGFRQLSVDTTNTIFGPMELNGFETYAQISENIQTMVNEKFIPDEEIPV